MNLIFGLKNSERHFIVSPRLHECIVGMLAGHCSAALLNKISQSLLSYGGELLRYFRLGRGRDRIFVANE